MITQEFYLKEYDWSVKIYYAVDTYYTDDILSDLLELDPSASEYFKAKRLLDECRYNEGFTYTNYSLKRTLIVIGLTSSPDEFQDVLEHEKGHLITHIGKYYELNPYGEEIQYLSGNVSKILFKKSKQFLCKHCRQGYLGIE